MREEFAELAIELRREGLVVCEDHRRALHALNHVPDGVRLPGSRDTEQRLVRKPFVQSLDELVDCLRLIPCGRVIGLKLERLLFHAR